MNAPGEAGYGGQGGYPAGPWDAGAQAPRPRNGVGIAALVFGVLAILTCWWLPIIGFLIGLLALILGVVGRGRAKRGAATNGGLAVAGVVLGALAMIANVILSVVVGFGLFAFFGSGGGNTLGQLQQCVSQARNAGNPAAVQQAIQQCQAQFNQQIPGLGGGNGGG